MLSLIKLPEVCRRRAESHDSVYTAIREELLTPPIKRGRTSAWPAHEIDAVTAAIVAGKSPDEIRKLVKDLIARRAELPQLVEFSCPPMALAHRQEGEAAA